MRPNVFTYFEQLDFSSEENQQLIEAWKDNWEAAGWIPAVLGRRFATHHPLYRRFCKAVLRPSVPTVNHASYEAACWVRWLAYSDAIHLFGPSLLIDYDVVATRPFPAPDKPTWLSLGTSHECYADKAMVDGIVRLMMERASEGTIQIGGRPHCSDMTLLNKLGHTVNPTTLAVCSQWPATNHLVHVSGGNVLAHGGGRSKLEIFKEIASKFQP